MPPILASDSAADADAWARLASGGYRPLDLALRRFCPEIARFCASPMLAAIFPHRLGSCASDF